MFVIELIGFINGKGDQASIPSIAVTTVRRPPGEREQEWPVLVGLVFLLVWLGTGWRGRCRCCWLRDTGPELHPPRLLMSTRMEPMGVIMHICIDIVLVVVPHRYGRKCFCKFRGCDN